MAEEMTPEEQAIRDKRRALREIEEQQEREAAARSERRPTRSRRDRSAGVEYAAWSQRFKAWVLDIVVSGGVFLVVDVVVAASLALLISPSDPAGWGEVVGAFSLLAFVLVFPAYLAFFHGGGRGQTPGKRSMEIAVREASTLGRIGYLRALARSSLPAVFSALLVLAPLLGLGPLATFAALVLLLDVLWPLWDSISQALHDKIAQTVVIRSQRTGSRLRHAGSGSSSPRLTASRRHSRTTRSPRGH